LLTLRNLYNPDFAMEQQLNGKFWARYRIQTLLGNIEIQKMHICQTPKKCFIKMGAILKIHTVYLRNYPGLAVV
jgi:hypothetical protein